jgi:stage V sporulation protein S
MDILRISAKTSPNKVAGAIAGLVRENGRAEMQAIGAGAINQAVKAVAIARGFTAPTGIELVCSPAFTEVLIDNENKTGIKFTIEPRNQL